jgi:hypothetical protein
MNPNSRTAAARAFVRSLNILLKFARMYDFGHPRTAKQYETAWSELHAALGNDNEAGMLLAVSGDQLLLDGIPLESAAAEKSFARMLSAAGIASIHFSPKVTQASLAKFARGFPTGSGSKPAQLAEQLKAALQGDPHIHVNEVCFVPADSSVAKSSVAAHIMTRTLGMDSEAANELFNDPEKLLQLIVAAEGTKGGTGTSLGSGSGSGGPGGDSGTGSGSGGPGGGGPGGGYGPGPGGSGPGGGAGVSGPVSSVHGSGGAGGGTAGTWNIVGGSGGGAPLDPNAGGFWLNNAAPSESGGGSGGSGAGGSGGGVSGGVPVSGSPVGSGPGGPGGAGGGSGPGVTDAGTWNIVGGSGGGAPLDPNAGGFWFSKGDSSGAPSGTGGPNPGAAGGPVGGSAMGHGGTGVGGGSGSGAGGMPADPVVAWWVVRAFGGPPPVVARATRPQQAAGPTPQQGFAADVRRGQAPAKARWRSKQG